MNQITDIFSRSLTGVRNYFSNTRNILIFLGVLVALIGVSLITRNVWIRWNRPPVVIDVTAPEESGYLASMVNSVRSQFNYYFSEDNALNTVIAVGTVMTLIMFLYHLRVYLSARRAKKFPLRQIKYIYNPPSGFFAWINTSLVRMILAMIVLIAMIVLGRNITVEVEGGVDGAANPQPVGVFWAIPYVLIRSLNAFWDLIRRMATGVYTTLWTNRSANEVTAGGAILLGISLLQWGIGRYFFPHHYGLILSKIWAFLCFVSRIRHVFTFIRSGSTKYESIREVREAGVLMDRQVIEKSIWKPWGLDSLKAQPSEFLPLYD